MIYDIELCHIYLRDYLSNRKLNKDEEVSIDRALRRSEFLQSQGFKTTFSVMIDDEEGSLKEEGHLSEIKAELLAKGINVDTLIFESELDKYATPLIETIREHAVVKNNDEIFLNIATGDRLLWAQENLNEMKSIKRIFLETVQAQDEDENGDEISHRARFWVPLRERRMEGKHCYGCSLLTAVWYLHRLGVAGFCENGAQKADQLVNILPIKYLKSEGVAIDILNLSSKTRIRKARKKIDYIFI